MRQLLAACLKQRHIKMRANRTTLLLILKHRIEAHNVVRYFDGEEDAIQRLHRPLVSACFHRCHLNAAPTELVEKGALVVDDSRPDRFARCEIGVVNNFVVEPLRLARALRFIHEALDEFLLRKNRVTLPHVNPYAVRAALRCTQTRTISGSVPLFEKLV